MTYFGDIYQWCICISERDRGVTCRRWGQRCVRCVVRNKLRAPGAPHDPGIPTVPVMQPHDDVVLVIVIVVVVIVVIVVVGEGCCCYCCY